jgi:hypothetical protein
VSGLAHRVTLRASAIDISSRVPDHGGAQDYASTCASQERISPQREQREWRLNNTLPMLHGPRSG